MSGRPAEATVVSIAPRGVILGRTLYLLRLELDIPVVEGDAGVVLTRVFTDAYVHLLAFSAVQPKSKVPIRYDPRRPSDLVIDFEALGYHF